MKKLVKKKVVYERQTLFDQVWEEPVTKVAQKYGVSDVMIHKYCRKLAIPTPSPGYWRKKERGLKVQRKPRIPRFSGEQTITGYGMFEEDVVEEIHPSDVVDEKKSVDNAIPKEGVALETEPQTETIDPYKLSDELEEKCNKAVSCVKIVARRKWHPVIEKHRNFFTEWAILTDGLMIWQNMVKTSGNGIPTNHLNYGNRLHLRPSPSFISLRMRSFLPLKPSDAT